MQDFGDAEAAEDVVEGRGEEECEEGGVIWEVHCGCCRFHIEEIFLIKETDLWLLARMIDRKLYAYEKRRPGKGLKVEIFVWVGKSCIRRSLNCTQHREPHFNMDFKGVKSELGIGMVS
jgi:hypothetical protein